VGEQCQAPFVQGVGLAAVAARYGAVMEGYEIATYGERIAEIYDERDDGLVTEEAADVLATLAGQGPALELGIGTGRVALPLTQRGVEVHGIDISEAMVAKLRQKPGGAKIPVILGDFSSVHTDRTYSLVFVVLSTFFSLLTAEEQARCFANARSQLNPDGLFVVEAYIPDLARFTNGQSTLVTRIRLDEVELLCSRHDAATQRMSFQRIRLSEAGTRLYPAETRYAWPSELDLMAELAGFRLRDRWANWRGDPFGTTSAAHVSVYEPVSA
jgi:SAM-dependent methyltransferase